MNPGLYDDSNFGEMGEPSSSGGSSDAFKRHSDSVLCCSIDNHTRIAVSGGIDDTAFVWDLNAKHVIFECVGHGESVVASDFSVNSSYVATGDLNGHIQVRNTTTGIKIFDYDVDEINWLLWHNSSEFVLLAGTTKGDFWMWNVNDPAAVKTFPSYGSPTTTAKLLSDGMKIVLGYGDGSIRVFDLKTRQAILHLSDPSQSEIICLDLNPNNALLSVGCMDSTVKLINLNAGKVIGTLLCNSPAKSNSVKNSTSSDARQVVSDEPSADIELTKDFTTETGETDDDKEPTTAGEIEVIDEYNTSDKLDQAEGIEEDDDDDSLSEADDDYNPSANIDSVESVLFSPCGNYLAASNNSGSISIWDVASQVSRCEVHTGVGITRCVWTQLGNYVTGCLDGFVRIYDINLNLLEEIQLHSDQILDVAYKNGALVTASEDKTCRAIKLSK